MPYELLIDRKTGELYFVERDASLRAVGLSDPLRREGLLPPERLAYRPYEGSVVDGREGECGRCSPLADGIRVSVATPVPRGEEGTPESEELVSDLCDVLKGAIACEYPGATVRLALADEDRVAVDAGSVSDEEIAALRLLGFTPEEYLAWRVKGIVEQTRERFLAELAAARRDGEREE